MRTPNLDPLALNTLYALFDHTAEGRDVMDFANLSPVRSTSAGTKRMVRQALEGLISDYSPRNANGVSFLVQLTSAGRDHVQYLRDLKGSNSLMHASQPDSGTQIVVQGDVYGQVSSINGHGNVSVQQQTTNTHVNSAEIIEWITALKAIFPAAQIQPQELARLESAIEKLEHQLSAQPPQPGLIQGTGQAVLDAFSSAMATAALTNASAIFAGFIETGKALFG